MTAPTTAEVRERIERLRRERDALAADLARLSDEMGLPPTMGPADGELRRLLAEGRKAMAERDAERARADAAEAEVAALRRAYVPAVRWGWGPHDPCYEEQGAKLADLVRGAQPLRGAVSSIALATGLPATATPAEVVARVGEWRSVLHLIDTWRHTYGADLKPTAGSADTFGDGMRKAKAEIGGILASEAGR